MASGHPTPGRFDIMASLKMGVDINAHDASCCRSQPTNPRLRSLALLKCGAPMVALGCLRLHPRVLPCTWRTGSPTGGAGRAASAKNWKPRGSPRLPSWWWLRWWPSGWRPSRWKPGRRNLPPLSHCRFGQTAERVAAAAPAGTPHRHHDHRSMPQQRCWLLRMASTAALPSRREREARVPSTGVLMSWARVAITSPRRFACPSATSIAMR